MWGMIARITTLQGKRDEMFAVLRESGAGTATNAARVRERNSKIIEIPQLAQ